MILLPCAALRVIYESDAGEAHRQLNWQKRLIRFIIKLKENKNDKRTAERASERKRSIAKKC